MTYFSVDVETTGLNPFLHDVTSISVVEVFSEEHFTCQIEEPENGWNWDPFTLDWAHDNIPKSVDALPIFKPIIVCEGIERLLKEFEPPYTFVAWPASFDYPFTQKLYRRANIDPMPFHYRTVDVKSWICGQFNLPVACTRNEVNEFVGFDLWTEPAEPHNPYNDALEQARVFKRCLEANKL